MRRGQPVVLAAVICLLVLAAGPRPSAGAAPSLPTDDILEDFADDPRGGSLWESGGSWAWDPVGGTVISGASRSGSLVWLPNHSYTGSIFARLKLVAGARGAAARARIVFARDPQTGAHRFVQLTAGNPGTVIVGQAGTVGGSRARSYKKVRARIAKGRWLDVRVQIGAKDRVTVALGSREVLTATVPPVAPGQIGLASVSSKVVFDHLTYTADPDQEPCRDCHAGSARPGDAAEVYAYWDGSWWDGARGGSASAQQGGHGDPGGLFPMVCSGGAGCHNMRLPRVSHHRNGVYEPRENLTLNPWHLRREFINESPANPWDVQMTFDNFCATACHEGFGVADMRHQGVGSNRPYLQMGYKGTDKTGKLAPEDIRFDKSLTSAATGSSLFGTCVTCHDPHGTPTADVTSDSNHMVRRLWKSESTLCRACHL